MAAPEISDYDREMGEWIYNNWTDLFLSVQSLPLETPEGMWLLVRSRSGMSNSLFFIFEGRVKERFAQVHSELIKPGTGEWAIKAALSSAVATARAQLAKCVVQQFLEDTA